MAVHEKKESFKEHNDRGSILLAFYFVLTLLIPNLVLLYTEPYSIWSAEASLFIPMGFYLMWSAVLKRSGIMIWLAFPLVVLAAFQIVLLYLFGNSIIATDMFTNLLTTNPGEAGELLGNIYRSSSSAPSICRYSGSPHATSDKGTVFRKQPARISP